jgi:predicted phosphoribosyltransferase/pimeloyl-ACP methyl ester carboxylesterase
MIRFLNREDAGRRLADLLASLAIEQPIVLGIPRGGVPVAAEVARVLRGDLGVVVARKLRAPGQPELAVGAVSATGVSYVNQPLATEAGADDAYLVQEQAYQAEEARRREEAFDGHRRPPLEGRTVIVVDDGIATGATAIAALRSIRAGGAAKVILAVPVGPSDTIAAMRSEADEVYCLVEEPDFYAIGPFYSDFRPFEDDRVRKVLDDFERSRSGPSRRAASVHRDSVQLAVRLSLPAGPGPFPCVVFVHGLGSSKDSPRNVVIAERLLDAGFATLLFDLSGHGESNDDPRGAAAYVDDLAAVYGWGCAQPGVDARRMLVAGSSMGGTVAVEAVREGRLAPPPAGMVLRAPPIERSELVAVTVPMLVAVGSNDPLLGDIRAAVEGHRVAKLVVIPGASHLFEEPGTLDNVLNETVRFCQAVATAAAASAGG